MVGILKPKLELTKIQCLKPTSHWPESHLLMSRLTMTFELPKLSVNSGLKPISHSAQTFRSLLVSHSLTRIQGLLAILRSQEPWYVGRS